MSSAHSSRGGKCRISADTRLSGPGLYATLLGMDIQIHQADGRITHYPNATRYDLMPHAVLQIEIGGSLLFFNSGYWLQFAVDSQDPDPFNLNVAR